MSDESGEAELLEQELERALARLMELGADSMQIVVTSHGREGTSVRFRGSGNWYARVGAVRAWLDRADEANREDVRDGEA